MILYFSGTGNSAYIADRIKKIICDDAMNLFEKIRDCDVNELYSVKPWVIVTPTYAWRIPRILHDWLSKTKFSGSSDIYFVMTCADSIGNAGSYVKRLCLSKGLNYMGCIPIVMPENYIALFTTPSKEAITEIIKHADSSINGISRFIQHKDTYKQPPIQIKDKIKSGLINDIFYPVFVHAKKFYATNNCISCGKCEQVCPLHNIHLEKGVPKWDQHCTHCMACINKCPNEAIEYGRHTINKMRYTCKKHIQSE